MAPTKKFKTTADEPPTAVTLANAKRASSRIFQPFREIGHVTSDVPFSLQTRGREFFVTVAVGHCFQIYDCQNLRLKFVSEYTEHAITGLDAVGDVTFASTRNAIVKYERAKRVAVMVPEEGEQGDASADVLQFLVFGDHLVVAYEDNVVRVWDWHSCELHHTMEFGQLFQISRIFHPSTYLNKMLFVGQLGNMQLWNIRTRKLLYEFAGFGSPITAISQSPVVDVVAIGLLDGRIVLHDLRKDETLFHFQQQGRVSALSFRTDDHAMMASANTDGEIALWDLDERRLVYLMKDAHDGRVSSLQFLNGKPLLLTSGADNSLKEWIFDGLDGLPRLLRSRSGHHAPPTHLRYYDSEGRFLLSAARDRTIRLFSVFRDEQNTELSQGHLESKAKSLNKKTEELRLPFPVDFVASSTRERDWDNVISCHLNSNIAKTWSFDRKALGKHTIQSSDGSNVKCVAMSYCGNFGFLGCASGRVDMFNMQSGLLRKHFGARKDGHRKAVTGIASDANNRRVVSCSIDGTVKIWDLQEFRCLHTISVDSPIGCMLLQGTNNLVALASDDLCIRILDLETGRVVREFWGHDGRITDMTFSPDGRWLISAALDGTVRTWDLPSGHAIDRFKVDNVVTSVSFSPTGDFLATSHVNSVGICLWANRLQYANVELRRVPEEEEIASVVMPVIHAFEDQEDEGKDEVLMESDGNAIVEETSDLIRLNYQSPEQLAEDMITLSREPKCKWQNLLNLETIKKRNKPKEPPKAPENAPFFLPTVPGLEPKFLIEKDADENADGSRLLRFGDIRSETVFTRKLDEAAASEDYSAFFEHVKEMSPSALDFEIRSLDTSNDFEQLRKFLQAILVQLDSKRDFELLQSYLAVVLKLHGDLIVANADMFRPLLTELLKKQRGMWIHLESMFQHSLCLVDFVRGAV